MYIVYKIALQHEVYMPINSRIYRRKQGDALVSTRDSQGWVQEESGNRVLMFRSQYDRDVWLDGMSYQAERRKILSEYSVFKTRHGYCPAQKIPNSVGYQMVLRPSQRRVPVVFDGGRWIPLRISP